jgi:hypothetical protein
MSTERNYIEDRTDDGWREPTNAEIVDENDNVSTRRYERAQDTTSPVVHDIDNDRDIGTPYLPDQTSAQTGERWQTIQGEFVDDPRRSVTEAHALVSEVMQRVVDTFAQERADLERQWSGGEDVSTEDLRVCMQRYRAFFTRLLPLDKRTGTAH